MEVGIFLLLMCGIAFYLFSKEKKATSNKDQIEYLGDYRKAPGKSVTINIMPSLLPPRPLHYYCFISCLILLSILDLYNCRLCSSPELEK